MPQLIFRCIRPKVFLEQLNQRYLKNATIISSNGKGADSFVKIVSKKLLYLMNSYILLKG